MSITRQFPSFVAGQTWDAVSARQMQNLVEAVKALVNLDVVRDSGLSLTANGTGFVIGENAVKRYNVKQRFPIKRVAIVERPGDQDLTLQVREVDFADDPIATLEEVPDGTRVRAAALMFVGERFTAYADIGAVPQDYKGSEVLDDTPGARIQVYDARKKGDKWIVDKRTGSGGTRIAKVLATSGATITVQPLKERFDIEGARILESDGPTELVPVWPKLSGADYTSHVGPGVVIMLMQINDVWYAYQTIPRRVTAQTGVRRVNC
ncbi:MAG: hypothetical protein ACE5HE_14680 [Phycisphaerae bacterium]